MPSLATHGPELNLPGGKVGRPVRALFRGRFDQPARPSTAVCDVKRAPSPSATGAPGRAGSDLAVYTHDSETTQSILRAERANPVDATRSTQRFDQRPTNGIGDRRAGARGDSGEDIAGRHDDVWMERRNLGRSRRRRRSLTSEDRCSSHHGNTPPTQRATAFPERSRDNPRSRFLASVRIADHRNPGAKQTHR